MIPSSMIEIFDLNGILVTRDTGVFTGDDEPLLTMLNIFSKVLLLLTYILMVHAELEHTPENTLNIV
jgi:hypothetical protein